MILVHVIIHLKKIRKTYNVVSYLAQLAAQLVFRTGSVEQRGMLMLMFIRLRSGPGQARAGWLAC